ncbi:hypothetical protein NDN08_007242 [Rhodosorus marinus]|uniref:C2H2-type domain-containing protein n=1 Tax=Rhodosorus marinus TaxID=101924 RepID=A0AAV8UIX8_9RHOD|nr:hypothetical protein NDN08_007242 [Rhodosorus marinus]
MEPQQDPLMGKHVSVLSKHFQWDSLPMNWMMYRTHKQAVPHPSSWSMLLMDMKFGIPPITGKAMMALKAASMVSVINQPTLMMTEFAEGDYNIGSGWAFLGGLPDLNGRRNEKYGGLKRIRFINWLEDYKAVVIISAEVQPGLIAFIKLSEVDGRLNYGIWAVVDKDSEKIFCSQAHLDRRPCDMCRLTGELCDPRSCTNIQSLSNERAVRRALLEQSDPPVLNMEYAMVWLSGNWIVPVGPLEPVTIDIDCYASGSVFEVALVAVLQAEVESVHPPRSSYRTVHCARSEMDYFLELEDLSSEFGGMETSSSEFRGIDTSSSEEPHISSLPYASSGVDSREGVATADGHVCDLCGTSFTRAYDVTRHRRVVHQKRRDFQCEQCEKTFTQKGHLNEHIRVVHERMHVHPCPICDKRFGASSKLKRHMVTVHENRRSFQCNVCKNNYKEKSYLKQHMRDVHDVKMAS